MSTECNGDQLCTYHATGGAVEESCAGWDVGALESSMGPPMDSEGIVYHDTTWEPEE